MGLGQAFCNMECCDLSTCKTLLIQNFEKQWKQEMNRKPKLRFNRHLKTERGTERYVNLNLSGQSRSIIAQLRMGILPLRIETGRFINLKAEERICMHCNKNEMEDEMHFIFSCSLYDQERNDFLHTIHDLHPPAVNMSKIDLLILCFGKYVRRFAGYVTKIFEKRKYKKIQKNIFPPPLVILLFYLI